MKLLSELAGDQVLVQMGRAEMAALVVLGSFANVQVPVAKGTRSPKGSPKDSPTGNATCAVCGKVFTRHTSERVCSPACQALRQKEYAAKYARKQARDGKRPAKRDGAGKTNATCAVCGRPFRRKSSERTCSAKCRAVREKQYRQPGGVGAKKAAPEARAPAGNPSDPAMTAEERTEFIRQRAAAMGVQGRQG